MEKMMNLKEISEGLKGEWLLIEYEELDEELAVKRGRVIFHSPHKSEVYKHLLKIQGKNIAIEYAGKAPEELTVLFGAT
ncbi:hypothetical protein IBX65_06735, partial [Candidatus Aerophobetes bacterium]|nr:hypothetical protein [Candidatus Aerophobetes bacterium]